MKTKRPNRLKSLRHGRPPMPTSKPMRSISSKATRNIIRDHHNIRKEIAKALACGDDARAAALTNQIESRGGIDLYQQASLLGQSKERGGDSSRLLLEWLQPSTSKAKNKGENVQPLRILEIGALSSSNACSRSSRFEVERIDLNSQAEEIKQQDFMERPLPNDESLKFDIISLSLVLNFVPSASGRGEMLLRTTQFLKEGQPSVAQGLLPCLFLVLPAPCVTNSRYMDDNRLEQIMQSLGYTCVRKKLSVKLAYYLWRLETPGSTRRKFKKEEVRSGNSRNNFAIVIE
ncbi:hypothetical protein K3495_g155 [Podosphaera aphanis]|nr:hypothetical protein K3495_g155 [Podosphaera aphanis]